MAFLRSTYRNFSKDKVFTLINILGLTLGITSALMITLMSRHDLSFDTFHENASSIYRVNFEMKRGDEVDFRPTSPSPVSGAMMEEYSEVINGAYVNYRRAGEFLIEGEKEFAEESGVAITSSAFFDLFSFPVAMGDINVLDQPNQAVLSKSIAIKFFGEASVDVIGKSIEMDGQTYTVGAIVEDFPTTTDLPFTILLSMEGMREELRVDNWGNINMSVNNFIQVNPGTDVEALEAKLPDLLTARVGERMASFITLRLQPLNTIHFDARYGNYSGRTIPDRIVWGLALMAVVLLLTACINFINLSTANAIRRSKEVGIRKILGVGRAHLVKRFMGETALLTTISFLIAVPITKLLHPIVEDIAGFSFDLDLLGGPMFWAISIGIALAIIVLAGIYPAFFMSRYDPLNAVRSAKSNKQGGGALLRKSLVVFQFMISQVLLIALFIVRSQLGYFLNADMGFDREGVIVTNFEEGQEAKGSTLKDAWSTLAGVTSISLANGSAASQNRWMSSFTFEGMNPDDQPIAELKIADVDYLQTYDFELLAGRNYLQSDSSTEIVVNETLINMMGITDPQEALGKTVTAGMQNESKIVGVIEDFFVTSMYEKINPTVIMQDNRQPYGTLNTRINVNDMTNTIALMEAEWQKIYPNAPFEITFLDESISEFYTREQRLSEIITWVAGIALFIGAIGLYGLITYVVNQRQKEIGVRKVMGAKFKDLIYVISKDFVLLLCIAFAISAPLAWYFGNQWLESYLFRIDIELTVFILAFAASLMVALMSIAQKCFQATKVNPVETLRDE